MGLRQRLLDTGNANENKVSDLGSTSPQYSTDIILNVERGTYTKHHVIWQQLGVRRHGNQRPVDVTHWLLRHHAQRQVECGVQNDVAEPNLLKEGNYGIAEGNEKENIGFEAQVNLEIISESGNGDPRKLQSSLKSKLKQLILRRSQSWVLLKKKLIW